MADRRCIHRKIVESDRFYKLPPSAQALYLHLNILADDDGFINCAGSVVSRFRTGKADLKALIAARFLLQFGEIYVIKDWRVANSLKNDRAKPLAYPDIAGKIWVSPSRAYLDAPMDGCITLLEHKTGFRPDSKMDSTGIPENFHSDSQPNRTEPNRTERNRTESVEGWFAELWASYPEEKRGSEAYAQKAYRASIHTEADARTAVENLAAWKSSEQWNKAGAQYVPSMSRWLTEGIWQSRPTRMAARASGELGQAELEAIQRVLQEP